MPGPNPICASAGSRHNVSLATNPSESDPGDTSNDTTWMSYVNETFARTSRVANQLNPFCTSATTLIRSAELNFKSSVDPSTITTPTATDPTR